MPDFSTYAARQAYRDAHPGVVVDASGASDGAKNTGPSGGSGGGGAQPAAVAFDPQASTAAMNAAGFLDSPSGRAGYAAAHGGQLPAGGTGLPPLAQAPGAIGLDAASMAALNQFGAQASGVTQAQLAEQKREFDANLAQQQVVWERQGLPTLVIAQRTQALQEQEYQSNLELARQNMALQTQAQQFSQGIAAAGETGMYNGAPTLAARNQALDYLKTAASLQGPENVFQQSNFYRGAQGNTALPTFLAALQQNSRLPAFNAPGTPANVLSVGSVANRLTGQGGNAGFDPTQSLAAVQGISNAGAQKLVPGSLERLTPEELAALGSGLGAVGNTLPAFLTAYQQSRPQQSAMSGDMSLAA